MKIAVVLCGVLLFQTVAQGAEYFVGKNGADVNDGASRETAFLTVQKGVDTLKPGDTLTIGPGEYFENVKLRNFGDLDHETVIRAELPGTVVLRGDRDVESSFSQVPGQRFVYAADCKLKARSVQEADTLTNLSQSADRFALEFGTGRFYYDAAAQKLYVSSSDFQPAERHHYTVGVLKDHGFHMFKCKRVVIDGLAATGYRVNVGVEVLLLPVSGFLLQETQQCVVRRCAAFFNGSGIVINSGIGGSSIEKPGEGRLNLVEDCVAYANGGDGIVGYNPSGETIRNCRTFLNQIYGARFYGGRFGTDPCTMSDVIAWGNPGGDFWTKGGGLSGFFEEVLAERCVAFRGCMFGNFQHGIIGGGSQREGDRASTINLPDGRNEFHDFLNANFADPLNYDFRFQATSSLRNAKAGNTHKGLHPYEPNVYYVKTNGNDAQDGLSMANAWKTPSAAIGKLKPGDTLYIAPGRYEGSLSVTAKDIRIRGRGIEPAVIQGGMRIANSEEVSVERLQFFGAVPVEKSKEIELANCVFAGEGAVVGAQQVQGLRVTHAVLGAPLELQDCSGVILTGNLNTAAPAVLTDSLDAISYSSYNSYPNAARCWEVGGKILALNDLRPRQDVYSVVLHPELAEKGGVTTVANAYQFGGRGPLSTAIGPYREWQPKEMNLIGPFVESKSDASADIEWWGTLPVQVELCWGDTPACVNKTQITQNAFYNHSLIGLQPRKTYYVKVVPKSISVNVDPARRFRLAEGEAEPVKFVPGEPSSMKNEPPKASMKLPAQLMANRRKAHPVTYYVSTDGNDEADGLSRQTAWESLQHAINSVRPGDTVLLGGGVYPGTFYFRTTGEPDKPIKIKSVPGERAVLSGMEETLKIGFVMYGKHYYRLDSLYFKGYAGIPDNWTDQDNAALCVRGGSNLQVTRCHFGGGWGPGIAGKQCANILIKNCVFTDSMGCAGFTECSKLLVTNCVFTRSLISHISVHNRGEPFSVTRCIFGENLRHKVHQPFLHIRQSGSDNCFYIRLSKYDRNMFYGDGKTQTLPEYRAQFGDDGSFVADPYQPGALGFRQGWQQVKNDYTSDDPYEPIEFYRLFSTNPKLILRDIGLQPDAFRDFHFWKEDWLYNKDWAAKVQAGMDAAEELPKAGQDAKAADAYANLTVNFPMSDRLKANVLDRAAQCAARAKKYEDAMRLAKTIPLEPLSVRRQMAILFEQKKYGQLTKSYSDAALGKGFYMGWMCPETDDVIADTLYYRGLAYAETGNLKAAEADMKVMMNRGYNVGETIRAMAWKRLGDFYRIYMKDKAKALEAYGKALETPSNPEINDALDEARKAVADLQRE